jgi:hypothetical protein
MQKNEYKIKIYDKDMKFITVLWHDDLIWDVFVSKTMNWWYENLTLTLNLWFTDKFYNYPINSLFIAKVYLYLQNIPQWQLIYTWVSDWYDKIINWRTQSVSMYFIWIQSVLFNQYVYDYVLENKETSFNITWKSGEIIQEYVVNRASTQYITLNDISSINVWDTFITQNLTTGEVIYKNTTFWYIWVSKLSIPWNFTNNKLWIWDTLTILWTDYTLLSFYYWENRLWALIWLSWLWIDVWTDMSIEIKEMKLWDLLKQIIENNEEYYYNIKDDLTLEYQLLKETWNKYLTFNREIVEVKTESDYEIVNFVRIYNSDLWIYAESYDVDSIDKYWTIYEKVLIDNDSLDITTLQNKANAYIKHKREESKQITIKIPLNNTIKRDTTDLLWWNETIFMNDEDITFWTEEIWVITSLELDVWEIINIRNIDYDREYTNLLIIKKTYDNEYITLYCNRYKNNWWNIIWNVFS